MMHLTVKNSTSQNRKQVVIKKIKNAYIIYFLSCARVYMCIPIYENLNIINYGFFWKWEVEFFGVFRIMMRNTASHFQFSVLRSFWEVPHKWAFTILPKLQKVFKRTPRPRHLAALDALNKIDRQERVHTLRACPPFSVDQSFGRKAPDLWISTAVGGHFRAA